MIQIHHPAPRGRHAAKAWLQDNIGWILVVASIWLAPHFK